MNQTLRICQSNRTLIGTNEILITKKQHGELGMRKYQILDLKRKECDDERALSIKILVVIKVTSR